MRASFTLCVALACGSGIGASAGATENDALAPTTRVEDALTGPLHTATFVTNDFESARLFFVDAMGMTLGRPRTAAPATAALQSRLWGIPDDIGWRTYLLNRPGAAGNIQVRLMVVDRTTPAVHASWSSQEIGPFSLGFPTTDLEAWDPHIRRTGFGSMNPMERYPVPRPDGTTYTIYETIFTAPEFLHAVGITRGDGMRQLGPIDPDTGNGGPVYSAQIVADSDAVLRFYVDVLGMELRSDREWESAGSKGAMANPDGAKFRFSIVYAKGARWGHLLFVHFRNVATVDVGVPRRPPNRGLVMWSFPVQDMDDTLRRLRAADTPLFAGPVDYESPALGKARVVTVTDPNGMLIELFERRAP